MQGWPLKRICIFSVFLEYKFSFWKLQIFFHIWESRAFQKCIIYYLSRTFCLISWYCNEWLNFCNFFLFKRKLLKFLNFEKLFQFKNNNFLTFVFFLKSLQVKAQKCGSNIVYIDVRFSKMLYWKPGKVLILENCIGGCK